jgi:hypothetical protein
MPPKILYMFMQKGGNKKKNGEITAKSVSELKRLAWRWGRIFFWGGGGVYNPDNNEFHLLIACCPPCAGFTLGIPDTVMGLTFIAAGVSVPDALSGIAVCKEGHGTQALEKKTSGGFVTTVQRRLYKAVILKESFLTLSRYITHCCLQNEQKNTQAFKKINMRAL